MAKKLTADSGKDTAASNVKARAEVLKESMERLYQCDREIASLIEESGIKDLRAEKSEIMERLRDDFNMPSKLVRARFVAYRIERGAEDASDNVTAEAMREMFELLPPGGIVNMFDAADQADKNKGKRRGPVEKADAFEAARTEGAKAHADNIPITDCPHDEFDEPDAHKAWISAWSAAQDAVAQAAGKALGSDAGPVAH